MLRQAQHDSERMEALQKSISLQSGAIAQKTVHGTTIIKPHVILSLAKTIAMAFTYLY